MTVLVFQDVRAFPDYVLFWEHGAIQLGVGDHVRYRWLCGKSLFCTENLFNCKDRLDIAKCIYENSDTGNNQTFFKDLRVCATFNLRTTARSVNDRVTQEITSL